MKTTIKRLTGLVLVIAMLLTMMPAAFSASPAEFVDFPTGWSKVAMEAAVNNGLLVGYENNEIRPEANLRRAEMAAIIARSFGAKTKADISAYTDVSSSEWYYDYIAKVVKMGAMQGVSATQMDPDAYITREEVFTAMARVLVLSSDNTLVLDKFPDKAQISSWAVKPMAALTERGYVNGDESGKANPKSYITREEFAQFMHNAIRTYIAEPGTYKNDMTGITVVRVGGVTLEGFTNTSDIVIGDGVLDGSVLISNVKIEKRLLARGGTITLKNTTVGDRVVVNNVNGVTYFKNYRNEKVFNGLVENTPAKFLTRTGGGSSSSSTPDKIYTITFKVDGTIIGTITVTNGVITGNIPTDPTKTGYTFKGWFDENGNKVTDFASVPSSMTLNAEFEIKTYKVHYNATFETGYVYDTEYTIENIIGLALVTKVIAPSGQYCSYWMDANGNRVSTLSVTDSTPEILELYPCFDDIPKTPVKVTFYRTFNEDDVFLIGQSIINSGETVPKNEIPETTKEEVSWKSQLLPSLYENNTYKHDVERLFWYVDEKTNKLVPFDETIVITKDTSVYMLSKKLSLYLSSEDLDLSLSATAAYNDETRVLNSVKDMSISGRNQLALALKMNQIPKYDEITDELIEKLSSIGIIDNNKNIKVLNIPIPISRLIKEETSHNMVKDYIRSVVVDETGFDLILQLTAFPSETDLKNYVKGLDENGKIEFANNIFDALNNDNYYKKFKYSLLNENTLEVNKSNLKISTVISKAIRELTYEDVMGETNNAAIDKLLEVFGEDFIKGYFDTMKNDYCDGLDDVIKEVTSSSSLSIKRNYTTSLTLKVDIINDVYKKLYEKAMPKVVEKLKAANIYYNDNEYLKFLVNHDILGYLVNGDSSLATDELTGYSLRGVLDYYDYILMLLIVGDDALCWYGDENELSEEKFEALYDAMFGKVFAAHDKLNELLAAYEADGKLPSQVQNVISKVKQINDLLIKHNDKIKAAINKYFNSSINLKFEDGSIADDERVIKISDFIFGKEEPVINIDTIYALFYSYDDKVQEKLQELIDSGKLDKAIAKFESTSFGELFSGKGKLGTVGEKLDEFKQNGRIESAIDSVYDLLVIIAKEGIEPFRTDKDKVDVMDAYEVTIGKVNFKVKRYFK